ncbi:MAG: cell division protein FtsQ/DivIB [Flavobacteriaceae bacterium]|tara:strand:- start:2227 stop:2949 length:723 start_codon:yes stop_codon:yes gene_type:complete
MKRYLNILILIFSTAFILSISIYGTLRNQNKKKFEKNIVFSSNNVFLNDSIVNKLLTQILYDKYLKRKDSLDLNIIETELRNNQFIKSAEVYWKFHDVLEIRIKEREPLYIMTNENYYVDSFGKFFPMKEIKKDLPRVLSELSKINLKSLTNFVLRINKDQFMKSELDKIYFEKDEFRINLKSFDFDIIFGNSKRLKEKVEKLKVFCAFQKVQDSLTNYPLVNLNYLNQVIASKSLVYEK